jgi:hypothetical protein
MAEPFLGFRRQIVVPFETPFNGGLPLPRELFEHPLSLLRRHAAELFERERRRRLTPGSFPRLCENAICPDEDNRK